MAFYRPTNLRDYKELTRRLLRRKWLILGVFSMVLAVSGGLVLRMPKMYKSTAMILIQPGQMNNAVVVNLNLEARLRTLRQTITSRTELESIVLELNLFPELRETRSMDDVVEFTRRRVEVVVQGRDLFQVSFVHENPNVAQVVAERLSRKLIDESASDDVKSSRDKVDFLTQRTEQLKRDLKEWDAKIQQFNEDNAEILVLEQGASAPIAAAREQLKAIELELQVAPRSRPQWPTGGRGTRGADRAHGTRSIPRCRVSSSRGRDLPEPARGLAPRTNTDGHPDVVSRSEAAPDRFRGSSPGRRRGYRPAPTSAPSRRTPAPGRHAGARDRPERGRSPACRAGRGARFHRQGQREHARVAAREGSTRRARARTAQTGDGGSRRTEVRKLAEAETNFNVVAANKGDSFKVQDPANLPEQPDSPRKGLIVTGGRRGPRPPHRARRRARCWSTSTRPSTTSTSCRG
jgi:succinoglycan biosynthesis transport protein ExoP